MNLSFFLCVGKLWLSSSWKIHFLCLCSSRWLRRGKMAWQNTGSIFGFVRHYNRYKRRNFLFKRQKVDRNALRTALDGRETWNTARYHWKYTVGMNFVPGAPLFNVNSVRVDGGESFTAAQWISIIKQYKNSQLTRMDPPTFISSSSWSFYAPLYIRNISRQFIFRNMRNKSTW